MHFSGPPYWLALLKTTFTLHVVEKLDYLLLPESAFLCHFIFEHGFLCTTGDTQKMTQFFVF